MTTDRQRPFFPEDEVQHQKPSLSYSILCEGGPKNGESVQVSGPPTSYLLVSQLRRSGLCTYSNREVPSLRPPLCIHEYKLQELFHPHGARSLIYEYQGLR